MISAFINIKELVQVRDENPSILKGKEMDVLPTLQNAFLIVEKGLIKEYGNMDTFDNSSNYDEIVDVTGKMIIPSFCDSHTHIVYAKNREQEFVDRIHGLTYEEIAAKGGGILNSAKKLQETSEEDLYLQASKRLEEVISLGTGAVEIKSGYGLSVESELKMLRVIKKLKENYPIPIKSTFLGAHAIPTKFKSNRENYINLIIDEMLPQIAKENLADHIDVFCETGYFNPSETDRILIAGKKYGLSPKVHVNQFTTIGGIEVSVNNQAISVDHLEVINKKDIEFLKNSKTIPVALPSCSFFLSIPYTPVKELIRNNIPLALATDYNPGSTPSGNMNFVIALACIKMKMTPNQAFNAATINGAYAMKLENEVGSITPGKRANFYITKEIPSLSFIPYSFGSNLIESVYLKGKLIS